MGKTNQNDPRKAEPTNRQRGYATLIVGFAQMAGLESAIDSPDFAVLEPVEVVPLRVNGVDDKMWVSLDVTIVRCKEKRYAELMVASRYALDNIEVMQSLIVDAFRDRGFDTIQSDSFTATKHIFTIRFECRS